MCIVPLLVTISAEYRLAGSMHIGGRPLKRWRLSLEPSAAGQSIAMKKILSKNAKWEGRSGLGDGHF
jgi:hypothetical protein